MFIPYTWRNLVKDIQADKFDIAIGAIYVDSTRLEQVNFSKPYFHSPHGFSVMHANASRFRSTTSMRTMKNLRIATINDALMVNKIKNNLPNAKIVFLPKFYGYAYKALMDNKADVVYWNKVQQKIWALQYPSITEVYPKGVSSPFIMAYMMHHDAQRFRIYVNYWLGLKELDGFKRAMYQHWIQLRPLKRVKKPWNVITWIRQLHKKSDSSR